MLNLPYTSCDAATSAITFNKRYAVAIARMAGIQVANQFTCSNTAPTPAQILQELKLPVFVKPNNGGSSIGMSKVSQSADLGPDKALREDDQVLIEEMVRRTHSGRIQGRR